MDRLDELKNGTIERIEIRMGIPRRVIFKIPLEAFAIDAQLTTGTADQREHESERISKKRRSRDDC
jgi:hypothetical protein